MEELQKNLKIYNKTNKILKALDYVEFLNSWDIQTEAPIDSIDEKNEQMEFFNAYEYSLKTSKKYLNAVDYLYSNKIQLDEILRHEIVEVKDNIEKTKKIPQKEYINYQTILSSAYNNFVSGKNEGNYEKVKPYLKKIIDFKKKYIKWQNGDGYNALLDEYEKNSSIKMYDEFFAKIKEKLVPLIKQVNAKKLEYNKILENGNFDTIKQKEFSKYLLNVLQLDKNKMLIKESEHPFTTNFCNTDIRITNHYHSDMLKSAIFSDIHEMGHALYEMQVDDKLNKTLSGGGASMAMHESQSRFMENLIGRNYYFWKANFPKLKELFCEELKDCTLDDFYKYINESKCDFVRTEADELTYPIHVLIRYEIEKGIFENKYSIDELPKVWNEFYKNYLGVTVPNNTLGVLQDMHWYCGDFGYFPTYALGSAYASQIYHAINKEIDIEKEIENNNLKPITDWLKSHIHTYGSTKYPNEILEKATNEKFNPNYYIDYLCKKYKKLYNID